MSLLREGPQTVAGGNTQAPGGFIQMGYDATLPHGADIADAGGPAIDRDGGDLALIQGRQAADTDIIDAHAGVIRKIAASGAAPPE